MGAANSGQNPIDMHATHPQISKRLRRANGHLEHIIEMLAEGRSCMEVAQQLQAVEKAIDNAKKALIQDHIDHCLQETVGGDRSVQTKKLITEFRDIAKYL
jgi:DNA-binding FrmR family transcriptional regulator